MDIEPKFWVRVLLLDRIKSCTITVSSPFSVINPQTHAVETRFGRFDESVDARIAAGRIVIAGKSFNAQQVVILPDEPYIFNINGDSYRGKLKLIINDDGESFDAVNIIPLEPYLAGVVGAEMPDYWEPAALQAQAIAARTYCLYIKNNFGVSRNWDLKRTQANQVYLGLKAESALVWDAVNQTRGQVLVCRQNGGDKAIFPTYYSSTCGGHTENSKNVFGDSFEPLTGVYCPYCKNVAKPCFFFWPMAQFDKKEVTKKLLQRYPKLKGLGEVTNIVAARQSDYGEFSRLTLVKLHGSTGKSGSLRAEDLRLTVDPTGRILKSTICKAVSMGDKWAFLAGRGYGHGVGMCQCGAQGMARKGKSATQILSYYYPGSGIITVY